MDAVFDLPYQRVPHPVYGDAKIPAYDMIRRHHADEVMFALVNGDVIYEERRDGKEKKT